MFMTLIVLLPIKSKQINDEMPDAYVNILSEYERVMNDKTYSRDQWKNIYDYVLRFIGKTDLYYCIKDLSGDGKTELILGTKQEIKFEPFIIYSFEESAVYCAGIRENYIMTIYEGGIIEYISGGVWQHFMYERLDGDSAVTDLLAVLVKEEGDGKSPVRYY